MGMGEEAALICRRGESWYRGRCMARITRRPLRGTTALCQGSGTQSWMQMALKPASLDALSASCLPKLVRAFPIPQSDWQ